MLDVTLGLPGHHHHEAIPVRLERGVEDLETRHLRHEQIDQDQVELPPADQLQRFLAPPGQGDAVSLTAQDRGAALPQRPLVVDDQDPDRGLDIRRQRQHVATGKGLGRSGARTGSGYGSHQQIPPVTSVGYAHHPIRRKPCRNCGTGTSNGAYYTAESLPTQRSCIMQTSTTVALAQQTGLIIVAWQRRITVSALQSGSHTWKRETSGHPFEPQDL